jgi:hypothetical protein
MAMQGIKLYFEGVKILKAEILERLFEDIYTGIFECLQLYKEGKLREYEPLQVVIKYMGISGFTKFKLVDMAKIDDRFEYSSLR